MTDPIAKSDGELSRKPTGKSSWVIRATREEDCEGITELVNMPGFRHGTLRMPFQSVEQTRKWIRSDDPDKLNIVAVADGKVVGQAGLHRFSGRRAHAAGIGMGVHDAWQRQGVGTTLLAALVDAADNWMGLKRIELTVFSDNAAAIRLYEKFGFEPEGICRAFAFRTAVTPMRYLWRGFRILPARRADFTPLGNAPRQSAVVAFAVWTSQGFTHKPTPNAGGVRRPFLHAQMGLAALKSKPFPPGSR